MRDISARKEAQLQMELLKAAFNAAPDAIMVFDPVTWEYVDVNEAAAQLYGVPREEMISAGIAGASRQDDATRDYLKQIYAKVIAQSPLPDTDVRRLVRTDGCQPTIEATRRAMCVDGRWLIVSVNRNITQRKAAQARQELLTAAIEAAPDGIAVVDPVSLQYLHVNEAVCRTHAASREQLMQLGVDGMFRDQLTPDAIRALYQSVIDSYPGATSQERAIVALDGSTAYYEAVRRAVQVDGQWLIVSMNRNVTERKAAQARMETLTEAFNVAPDPIVVVDPQTMRYVDVNEAATRLVGQSRKDMLALGLRGVFPQEQAHDGLQDVYQEAIDAAPNIVTRERTVFDSQGNPRILEGTRRAARIDGRWLVVSVTRDITDRKGAQERAERFAAVVNLSADAVFVVDRATLRILDVNEAACRMYGRSRDEMLALPPNVNRPGMDTADLEKLYDETIARSPQVHHMEHEAIRADGTIFHAETQRLAIQSEGQWLILATVRDITDRKRAESEIRRRVAELELLREAYDAAVDAILIADPETLAYYDVNHAAVKLLGVSREELLTRGVEASYYSTASEPFDADRLRKGYRYVISRAPDPVIDVRTINPLGLGGRDTVIEFSRRGVNVQGRWVVVTLMRDITAAQRAEEEIRQRVAELTRSNQELEQFAYVTSHDLSEPLRMVASYTQLLSRRYADKFDDDGREFIKYAVDGAQRMKQLIDDLLMYSRAGRAKVPMRQIRLDRSLDDALANLANAVERNGATIERGPLPELVCEKAGLTQVFQNLVGNAIKFRGESAPVVRIHAVEDEHFWTVSVADNGIGIAPEYFQRIFIIFQRLHARTKYEGTGIGLSICKKIVERHGGQISVTSGPGQGTTFSFTLSKSLSESEPS
jgi:PAS domain S-box-containing protein